MSGTIETLVSGKHKAVILQDQDAESPRSCDNLSTMICGHRRYDLGDEEQPYSTNDFTSWAAMGKAIMRDHKGAVLLPLYLYDHGGITISTRPFSCPWDSGQVGFALVTPEKIREEYSCKRITAKTRAKVEELVRAEVEEYDLYLQGECYGYIVKDENGEEVDSCWGFLGLEHVQEEARNAMEHLEKAS